MPHAPRSATVPVAPARATAEVKRAAARMVEKVAEDVASREEPQSIASKIGSFFRGFADIARVIQPLIPIATAVRDSGLVNTVKSGSWVNDIAKYGTTPAVVKGTGGGAAVLGGILGRMNPMQKVALKGLVAGMGKRRTKRGGATLPLPPGWLAAHPMPGWMGINPRDRPKMNPLALGSLALRSLQGKGKRRRRGRGCAVGGGGKAKRGGWIYTPPGSSQRRLRKLPRLNAAIAARNEEWHRTGHRGNILGNPTRLTTCLLIIFLWTIPLTPMTVLGLVAKRNRRPQPPFVSGFAIDVRIVVETGTSIFPTELLAPLCANSVVTMGFRILPIGLIGSTERLQT